MYRVNNEKLLFTRYEHKSRGISFLDTLLHDIEQRAKVTDRETGMLITPRVTPSISTIRDNVWVYSEVGIVTPLLTPERRLTEFLPPQKQIEREQSGGEPLEVVVEEVEHDRRRHSHLHRRS